MHPALAAHDYAAELNPEQYAAVMTEGRHVLVIAGAGSGKTRTLTYRVTHLLEEGVPPWRLLLLTFTNKAAREMLQRVAELTQADIRQLWGGTFHSVAYRILRRHAERLGYRPGFTILDGDDQRTLMRAVIKEVTGTMAKKDRFPKPEVLLAMHSLAANTVCDWESVLVQQYAVHLSHREAIGRIFESYAAQKLARNAMDFDDLLLNTLRLLREHDDLRADYSERFLHVLVDEYQDTNALQEELISLLSSGAQCSLTVVGDDAQSIYSWRGANVQHILDFEKRYADALVYKIETNYRSVPPILSVSNAAIAQNTCQYAKVLQPARGEGAPLPVVVAAPSAAAEAYFVAGRIDELLASGLEGKDIAVLYRAHSHSLEVQMALARARIPFRVTSGLRFFEQAHVKDALAYLRLLVNPYDVTALLRILESFPGVGEVTAQKLAGFWLQRVRAWFGEHPGVSVIAEPHAAVIACSGVPARHRERWQELLSFLDSLHPNGAEFLPPRELMDALLSRMEPLLRSSYDNADERLEDLEQVAASLAAAEGGVEDFLSQTSLLSSVDSAAESDCVTLSTVHQAKGLEWKAVFVIFLGEGLFPLYRVIMNGDPHQMEEETRLFYVALTRAEDRLFLSFPRYNGGSYDCRYYPPSRFLTSLPPEMVEVQQI